MSTKNSTTTTSLAPIGPLFGRQVQAELLRMWRTPGFLLSSLVLPSILYSILGLSRANGLEGGVSSHVYTLASVATYGVVSVMLYSFGFCIANERVQRVHVLMRATPLPAWVYLLAKMVTALLSALAMLLLLSGLAIVAGGVQLSGAAWITLISSLALGALPFVALGFAIGNVVSPTSAAPIINLSFFVFAFASGIFAPLSQLPDIVQSIAPYLPLYRLAQLAWSAVGVQTGSIGEASGLLLLYGVFFIGFAIFAYRAEERRAFG
jgi:ABC-2 type transport system permease protein